MYNDVVKDHFASPRNAREIADATAVAEVDNPVCGDILKIFLKIFDGTVQDVGVKTRGCAAAIAAGSLLTELIRGQTITEVSHIDAAAIVEALGGLPRHKRHAANLAADALQAALNQLNE